MTRAIVIVGAGHAGGRAAQALRARGYDGLLQVVGDEPHRPYERPPLSKGLLTGSQTAAQCALRPEDAWQAEGVEFVRGRAVALDTTERRLTLADGRLLPCEGLLLATGGTARTLPIPGVDLPGVHTLRTLDDAAALAPRLAPGQRLVVVGGGFIGLEVAASARARGCTVQLLEAGPRLLGRAVPAELAGQVAALHQRQGVALLIGQAPQAIARGEDGTLRLRLTDRELVADTVVIGIGIVPATALAEGAGLQVQPGGIVVDAQLAVQGADGRGPVPGVWACGDAVLFPSPLSGEGVRMETWHNAETQAACAAANLLGAGQAYADPAWFWSDQYDHQLQVAGEPALGARQVLRVLADDGPDGSGGAQLRFHLAGDGRLVGASAWGPTSAIAREAKLARMLVERRAAPQPSALADPAVKLKSLL